MGSVGVALKTYVIPGDQDTWVQGQNGTQQGPFAFKSIVTNPNFGPDTLVWTEQTGDWTPLSQLQLSENDITKTVDVKLLQLTQHELPKPKLEPLFDPHHDVQLNDDLTPVPLRPSRAKTLLSLFVVLAVLGFALWSLVRSLDNKKNASVKLLQAAYSGNIKAEESALNDGADVNYSANGWTALMYAVFRNDENSAKLIMKYHPNTAWKNSRGQSARSIAEANGNKVILDLLHTPSAYSNDAKELAKKRK